MGHGIANSTSWRPRHRSDTHHVGHAVRGIRVSRLGMVRQWNVMAFTLAKIWHASCFISLAPATHASHAGLARGTGTVHCVPGHGRESRGRLPARLFQEIARRKRDALHKKADARRVFRNRGDPLEPGAGRRTVAARFAPCRFSSQCDVVCQSSASSARRIARASDVHHISDGCGAAIHQRRDESRGFVCRSAGSLRSKRQPVRSDASIRGVRSNPVAARSRGATAGDACVFRGAVVVCITAG